MNKPLLIIIGLMLLTSIAYSADACISPFITYPAENELIVDSMFDIKWGATNAYHNSTCYLYIDDNLTDIQTITINASDPFYYEEIFNFNEMVCFQGCGYHNITVYCDAQWYDEMQEPQSCSNETIITYRRSCVDSCWLGNCGSIPQWWYFVSFISNFVILLLLIPFKLLQDKEGKPLSAFIYGLATVLLLMFVVSGLYDYNYWYVKYSALYYMGMIFGIANIILSIPAIFKEQAESIKYKFGRNP